MAKVVIRIAGTNETYRQNTTSKKTLTKEEKLMIARNSNDARLLNIISEDKDADVRYAIVDRNLFLEKFIFDENYTVAMTAIRKILKAIEPRDVLSFYAFLFDNIKNKSVIERLTNTMVNLV